MYSRTDSFGILAITVSIVASVWVFRFADDVFSTFHISTDATSAGSFYQKSPVIKESQSTENVIQENISEHTQSEVIKPDPQIVDTKIETPEPVDITPKISISNTEDKIKKSPEKLLQEKIQRLEKQSYVLSGDGSGYEGAAYLAKFAEMDLEIRPVLDTNLSEFSITHGTLEIGGLTFVIKGGSVTLDENSIYIDIEHNDHRDPYLNMKGKISGSIFDEKPLLATFENQKLGLMKQDPTPLHLSLELKLSSQN